MKNVASRTLELPLTFYFIQGKKFEWTENTNPTPLVYTIPDGSYSNLEFITMLLAGINALSALTYTMTFSDITGKFTNQYP